MILPPVLNRKYLPSEALLIKAGSCAKQSPEQAPGLGYAAWTPGRAKRARAARPLARLERVSMMRADWVLTHNVVEEENKRV